MTEPVPVYGALYFAEATGDGELHDRIEVAYTPCLSGEIKPKIDHLDNNLFGILPFELFRQTGRRQVFGCPDCSRCGLWIVRKRGPGGARLLIGNLIPRRRLQMAMGVRG